MVVGTWGGDYAQLLNKNIEQPFLTSSGWEVIQDQADFIGRSLNSVRNAALMGGFLAMLVVLIFLGSLRKTCEQGAQLLP